MKILFHITANNIDNVLKTEDFRSCVTYNDYVKTITMYGSASMIGYDNSNPSHFLSISNSEIIQNAWLRSEGIELLSKVTNNLEVQVFNQQIEVFKPDVILTVNPDWIIENFSKIQLHNCLLTVWKASPISKTSGYELFKLGLSFNKVYLTGLLNCGVKHVDEYFFNFNYDLINNVPFSDQHLDVSFSGTYNDHMFESRTKYLHALNLKFGLTKKIRFYFRVNGTRLGGLLQNVPLRLCYVSRKPKYFKQYLKVIRESKIVFNCHSDITGNKKGNMRVFETLGMKSFLLTDDGIYPPHLEPEKDFITYKNEKDLIDKTHYFLKNDAEREEIASNGYETLKKYYNLGQASKRLESIFIKYL